MLLVATIIIASMVLMTHMITACAVVTLVVRHRNKFMNKKFLLFLDFIRLERAFVNPFEKWHHISGFI